MLKNSNKNTVFTRISTENTKNVLKLGVNSEIPSENLNSIAYYKSKNRILKKKFNEIDEEMKLVKKENQRLSNLNTNLCNQINVKSLI